MPASTAILPQLEDVYKGIVEMQARSPLRVLTAAGVYSECRSCHTFQAALQARASMGAQL
jgi:hypothetical protein